MAVYLQTNQVVAITAPAGAGTYVVNAADSGKTILIPTLNGNLAITLPVLAAGLRYRFYVTSPGA